MPNPPGWTLKQPFIEFILLVSMLMALTALSIDAMLPANPEIGNQFGVSSPRDLQLMVNMFFLGFACSRLFYGPLADRFGRKPVLLAGLAIFVFASVLAVVAASYKALIFARVIQGIGSGASRVLPTSIIRDVTDGRQMARVMSLTMMVFITVPVLAPAVGELILLLGPWQWIFMMLMLMACCLGLWLLMRLPETLDPEQRQPLDAGVIWRNIKIVAGNRATLSYTLALSFVFGAFNIYLSTSQPVFDQFYGLQEYFAVIFGVIAIFLGLASYLNSRLVLSQGMRKMSHLAMCGLAGISLLFVILCLSYDGLPPVWMFIGLMAALLFLIGIIFPNLNSLAMEPMGALAGTAASVIGSLSSVIGVLLGTLVGRAMNGSLLPMACAFLAYSLAAIVFARRAEKPKASS